jgi:hypothetical protein
MKSFMILMAIILLASSAVYAQDADLLNPGPSIDFGPNVNGSGPIAEATTYYLTMYPGAVYSNSGVLYDNGPADYDTYVMTVSTACTVTIDVEDCCITGDTICAAKNPKVKKCAVSPATVVATKAAPAGTYTFYVGYAACPGGYPAGYSIYVSCQ